jgi:peptide-methionine (S)-S-oxide reductase
MKYLTSLIAMLAFIQGANAVEKQDIKTAVFAGGCFWCVESDFDKVDGVVSTLSGYAGGDEVNMDYKTISKGNTEHAEVVKVLYDANKISYLELLNIFFKTVDPTVRDRQFCDVGRQYRTAIFYQTEEEKTLAQEVRKRVEEKLNTHIYTEISPLKNFNPAEDYHQDYYKKNPLRYKYYRYSCGRDKRVKQLWG